jgi:hypothetical protein
MKNKLYTIDVKLKGHSEYYKTIKRRVRAEQIGNFCPLFCTYLGKQRLVKSKAGDLSDPFRRDESYAQSFFIEVEEVGDWVRTH